MSEAKKRSVTWRTYAWRLEEELTVALDRIRKLVRDAEQLREVLRSVEWEGAVIEYGEFAGSACPSCGASGYAGNGHRAGCALAAALTDTSTPESNSEGTGDE